jgi:hypothetical protein
MIMEGRAFETILHYRENADDDQHFGCGALSGFAQTQMPQ